MAGKDAATGAGGTLRDYLALGVRAGTEPLDAASVDLKGAHHYWSEEQFQANFRASVGKGTVSMMEYLNGLQDGREHGEEARDRVATKEDRLVSRLLLCLRDGNHYGQQLEERLGELGVEGMRPGEMYRILWRMEQEGMVFCNREGGGFSVPQRWYALTEMGKAYLETYAGSLVRYREEKDTFSLFQDERPGQGRDRG